MVSPNSPNTPNTPASGGTAGPIMTGQEKLRWKKWADGLRQEMMTGLVGALTKSVDCIATETGTTKASRTLRSARFWRACQEGVAANDVLVKAGFIVEFDPDESGNVLEVTLRLNQTWLAIMQRALNRKQA